MNKDKADITIEKYLGKVDRYLKYIPVSEKTDILSELKSSFYERMQNGQTPESIIEEIEPAKELAMSYLGESIVRNQKFSFGNLMKTISFYSLASLAWLSIIPVLAILSVSFFLSSGVSILAGIMGLLKGLVHISFIEDFRFMMFIHELTGLPALLVGLLMAIIFFGLALLCWKGTVKMVEFLQSKKHKLKYG